MNTKLEQLQIGVFGGGAVTRLLYRPALAHAGCAGLYDWVWLADSQPGAPIDGPRQVVTLPYDEALQQPELRDAVDAIIVALPHHLHRDAVCAALKAGKHVFCEKPAALTLAELADMEAAAHRSGCVLAFCHFRRHLAAVRALKDVFERRIWGVCRSVLWREGGVYAWPAVSLHQLQRESGGEVLYDIGAHVFDVLAWWLGPLAVHACQADDRGGSAASFDVTLQAGKIPVKVSLSRLRRYRSRVALTFERATVTWDLSTPDRLHVVSDEIPGGEADLVCPGGITVLDGFVEELGRFARACKGKDSLHVGSVDAKHYVEVFEQCARLRKGNPRIEVISTLPPLATGPVVVTGASGFIGGHCVERLLAYGVHPTSLARRAMSCVRLMRNPLEPLLGDIADAEYLSANIPEKSVIFHCAAHIGGRKAMQRTIVEGTQTLLQVAEAKQARAVIILGSMLAHGCPPKDGSVAENDQFPFEGDAYGKAKAEMWERVRSVSRTMKTPVVVLEPTCVFGPESETFVANPLERMLAGKPMCIDGGHAPANLIYVDHLVEAMLAAASDAAKLHGQRFLLNEEEYSQTWGDFYTVVGGIAGVSCRSVARKDINANQLKAETGKSGLTLIRDAVRHYPPAALYVSKHPLLRWKRRLLGQPVEVKVPRVRHTRPCAHDGYFNHPVVQALHTTRASYASAAFRKATGWKPSKTREGCLEETERWIRETWPDHCGAADLS